MFKLFKDKVSRLIDKRDAVTIKRQKVHDKKNRANSRIEVKIADLEKKAWRNQIMATTTMENLNRQLEKIERDLNSEKEYLNSVPTYKPEDIKASVRASFESQFPTEFPAELVTGRKSVSTQSRTEVAEDKVSNRLCGRK